MKFTPTLLTIFVLAISSPSQAQLDRFIPIDLEQQKTGFEDYPVIQCPQVHPKYTEIINRLEGIKASIRETACTKPELVEQLKKEAQSLDSLIGQKIEKGENPNEIITSSRLDTFQSLIKKGTSTELTDVEVNTLQLYIRDVVTTSAQFMGLLNNEACFQDDPNTKDSYLSTVSSLVSGVSSALSSVSGPLGAKISLGGKLTAGLIDSIGTIIKARQNYNFEDPRHRESYRNNLCAYYDFLPDLERETKQGLVKMMYFDLIHASNDWLSEVSNECEFCDAVAHDFDTRVNNAVPYDLSKINYDFYNARSTNQIAKVERGSDPLTSPLNISLSELQAYYYTAEDTGPDEIVPDYYGEFGSNSIDNFDFNFETEQRGDDLAPVRARDFVINRNTNKNFMLTVQTVRLKTWAEVEYQNIQGQHQSFSGDAGRVDVAEVQEELESFLVDSKASELVQYYQDKFAEQLRQALSRHTLRIGPPGSDFDVFEKYFVTGPPHLMAHLQPPAAKKIAYIFSPERNSEDIVKILGKRNRDNIDVATYRNWIQQSRERIVSALSLLENAFLTYQQQCDFFKYGHFRVRYTHNKQGRSLRNICEENSFAYNKAIRDLLGMVFENEWPTLSYTSPKAQTAALVQQFKNTEISKVPYMMDIVNSLSQETPNYTKNWVESTTKALQNLDASH